MITQQDLAAYEGREHAKAKHDLLERYVKAYTMILGQSAQKLAFVDGFSGPWKSATEDHRDTSFGLSLRAIKGCSDALETTFRKRPTLRALWMEAEPEPFERLAEFARRNSTPSLTIEAVHGKFQDELERIANFVGDDFAFIFVDPKGYSGLIEPDVLAPLLRLPRAELLINYMWDHIRWAVGKPDEPGHVENLRRIYCEDTDWLLKLGGGKESERQCLISYEKQLRLRSSNLGRYRLRVLSYPIRDTHGQQRPKYYLVHTTHSATGLATFAEECERTDTTQNQIFQIAHVSRRERNAGTNDMFANQVDASAPVAAPATQPWLDRLPRAGDELLVDLEVWADLLEAGRSLPSALQHGLKELLNNGTLKNISAKRARPKNHVDPEKGEVIRRLK